MPNVHDRGGWPTEAPINKSEHHLADWERKTDALSYLLSRKGLTSVDQMRRAIEELSPEKYESLSYYERWAAAMEALLVEKKVVTREEIAQKADETYKRWS